MQEAGKTRARATALILAIGVNVLFLLLLLHSRGRTAQEPAATAMVWIAAALESRPQVRRSSPRDARPGQARAEVAVTAPAIAQSEAVFEPAGELPTGAAPSIDWYAAAESVAQGIAGNDEQAGEDLAPDSSSDIQVRPESFWIPPMKGKTEQTPGGGTRVWTSDLCYREYNPLDPDPFTGGYRNGGRTVCKTRHLGERQSEARAEAIADAIRRKRSGH